MSAAAAPKQSVADQLKARKKGPDGIIKVGPFQYKFEGEEILFFNRAKEEWHHANLMRLQEQLDFKKKPKKEENEVDLLRRKLAVAEAKAENERLKAENERLKAENERLKGELAAKSD